MAFYEYLESMLKFYGMDDFLTSFGSLLELKDEVAQFVGSRQLTELITLFDARDDYEIETLWDQFCADPNSPAAKDAFSRLTIYLFSQDQNIDAHRYLKEELILVRSACRLSSAYAGYAGYDRGGRCIQFQDKRREDILRVLGTWERFQLRHGKLDGMELSQAAIVALDRHDATLPEHLRFRCVLVDEFQDFSTLDLELIAKIPTDPLNGLFLTGDTAQKIYTKDFDLPQAGLGPGHRINRSIQKNYRNSRQILEAAHLLLESYANEATAKHEGVTVLKPEYAQRDGARPFVCVTNDPLRAAWALAGEWLASGYPGFSICIATANPDVVSVRQIRDAAPSGITTSRLTGDYQLRNDVVVVSDIYNIKGFEFSLIVILGMGAGEFPPKGVPAGEIWREALRLYVAMTRGRDEVCLVHTGEPSPFLTAMHAAVSARPLKFDLPSEPAAPPVNPIQAVKIAETYPPPAQIIEPQEGSAPIPMPSEHTPPSLPFPPEPAPPVLTLPEKEPTPYVIAKPVETPVYVRPDEDGMVINGVALLSIRGEPTVRKVAIALGRDFVQIHNDFMNLGVFSRPDQAVVSAFVFKVMDKYGCAPIFRQ